jgi:squalene monooxygenase
MKDCVMPIPGAGHVILAKPSPVIFYPITRHEVRMLIDFPNKSDGSSGIPVDAAGKPTVEAMKGYLKGEFLSQIPECMRPSFVAAVDEATNFPQMPNRKLDARPNYDFENVVLIGDALNMRHPTTGGGMSVGLWDMVAFSQAIQNIDCRNHEVSVLLLHVSLFLMPTSSHLFLIVMLL